MCKGAEIPSIKGRQTLQLGNASPDWNFLASDKKKKNDINLNNMLTNAITKLPISK